MVVPPLSSGALQEIGREGNKVGRGNIGRFHLVGDVAKPVINIKWLFRVAEYGGVETSKVVQSYCGSLLIVSVMVLVRELSHDSRHELTVQLELTHHASHIVWRRWWILGTTATATRSNHPARI